MVRIHNSIVTLDKYPNVRIEFRRDDGWFIMWRVAPTAPFTPLHDLGYASLRNALNEVPLLCGVPMVAV